MLQLLLVFALVGAPHPMQPLRRYDCCSYCCTYRYSTSCFATVAPPPYYTTSHLPPQMLQLTALLLVPFLSAQTASVETATASVETVVQPIAAVAAAAAPALQGYGFRAKAAAEARDLTAARFLKVCDHSSNNNIGLQQQDPSLHGKERAEQDIS
ncbi:hypothetical protein Emed_005912 [Eimeria media]